MATTKVGKQCKNIVKHGNVCHVHTKFEEKGSIYVMSNSAFSSIKIGRTSKDVQIRAHELFTTGVPSKFVVEYSRYTIDAALAEARVFRALSEHRVTTNREFFDVHVQEAMDAIDTVLSVIEKDLSEITIGECRVIPSTDV
jgi:hypothetical protein